MKNAFPIVLALAAGAFLPLQAGINAQLKNAFGSPVPAAFVSFAVGTLALFAYLVATRAALPQNAAAVPWWQWLTGGLLGACYVTLIVLLAPLLGAALTFGLVVAGQMAMALALDQFGLLGFAQHPVNLVRGAGAALIVAGVVLIRLY